MNIETIEFKGTRFAEIIRKDFQVESTKFFSPSSSSFQFGIVAHKKGYSEEPHYHKPVKREINDLQQVLFVQKGRILVEFFDNSGKLLGDTTLLPGDAINLVAGAHAIKMIEDSSCISVKQGPFIGDKNDKTVVGK